MIQYSQLAHRFVQNIPDHPEPGYLYISMEYGTAIHRCCCGCGEEVVTPFTPTDWKMTFDGETVSLYPSVGNWNLRCRSHYVVERGRVVEANPWSNERIAAERRRDKAAKTRHYSASHSDEPSEQLPTAVPFNNKGTDLWSRFSRWRSVQRK